MLQSLLQMIPKGNKRHPLVFYRLLETLQDRMTVARNKFLTAQLPRTSGVELLQWMLVSFDEEAAKSYQDDISLYTQFIEPYQDQYRLVFDPVWTKSLCIGKFTRGIRNMQPAELLLNCTVENPATQLPFDADWKAWKDLRAVRILYHNSSELPIDLFTGYVTFKKDTPSFVVISINVPLLLMKWHKYLQYCKESKIEASDIDFLKQTEYDQFFYDLLNIWNTNMLLAGLMHPQATAEQIASELQVPAVITSQNIIKNGIAGLQDHLNLIASRNLRLQDFLDTHWFLDMTSIRNTITKLEADIVLPPGRGYLWMEIIKIFPYLKMIAAVIHLDRDNPLYKTLAKRAYVLYYRNIKFAQLPSLQYIPALKTYVTWAMQEFENLFKNETSTLLEDVPQE